MKFEYFEIRPCIEIDGETASFLDMGEYEKALESAWDAFRLHSQSIRTFWTLYGRYSDPTPDGKSQFLAMAIGDFTTKNDAHEVMNAILAPMAAARDLILERGSEAIPATGWTERPAYRKAADDLDDVINQSSNMERI